ncbi:MAG: CoA transferase [Chloroflexi bacterium]|nr:CoA transferase [Chloroflexota bacterium]
MTTSHPHAQESPLGPYRALDLCDEKGLVCTRMLADLGADVIVIEPPGGSPVRRRGPFYKDQREPEKSLFWFAFNTSKRSVTLDLEQPRGRELLRELARRSDFLVESFPPGQMAAWGLGYDALAALNPRLIMTSITPFGQGGPYAGYRGSDITGQALGGLMYLQGEPDRPPVRVSTSQAYIQAGIQACVGTLLAHYHRELTGQGQHVDQSMQEAVVITMDNAANAWDQTQTVIRRLGTGREAGQQVLELVYPCRDGFMCFAVLTPDQFHAFLGWLRSEEMEGALGDPKWSDAYSQPGLGVLAFSEEDFRARDETITRFFMTKTKQELYEKGQSLGLEITPLSEPKDLLTNPQLETRGYWQRVRHPELDDVITYPGPPFRLSETPWQVQRRPPRIGEHNAEVYEGLLGLSGAELRELKRARII